MKIIIDVDDTTGDLLTTWVDDINKEFGTKLQRSDIQKWAISEYVPNHSQYSKGVYNLLTAEMYERIQPIPGALEGVKTLREKGHEIIFATSTPIGCEGAKLKWLIRHGFIDGGGVYNDGRVFSDYIEIHDKSLIRGDILIDDRDINVQNFPGNTILFDQPHNQSLNWLTRASGWDRVLELVSRIELDVLDMKSVHRNVDVVDKIPEKHITERRCPEQAAGFRAIIERMYKVHLDTNADYSPANILGTGELGLATRIWDKCIRYLNLLGFDIRAELVEYRGPQVAKNESIEDTLQDMAVYGIIGLLMRSNKWGH